MYDYVSENRQGDNENKIIKINMGENAPVNLEYSIPLHAIDFIKELKEELLDSAHIQSVREDMVYVSCFRQHVIEANDKMPIPLNNETLDLVMTPLTEYLLPICNSHPIRSIIPICIVISEELDQLISRRELSNYLFEQIQ